MRILLVEPVSLLRGALAAVLSAEDDLEVVGQSGRIEEVLPIGWSVRPDIILINIDTLGDGEVADELITTLPDSALVGMVNVHAPGAVWGALETRVRGFIGKDTAPAQLAEYLRRVARGERVIDPTLAAAAWAAPRNPLTKRECEILRMAALGRTSTEIANSIHLSVGTVRNYLSSSIRKTGTRTRLEAVRIATEAGWLQNI